MQAIGELFTVTSQLAPWGRSLLSSIALLLCSSAAINDLINC